MLSRLSKIALVFALAGSIGLHWTILQSMAWFGMVVSYSQTAPLTEALVKTFNGKNPCELCNQIQEGKKSEKKPDRQIEIKKLEFLSAKCAFILSPPNHFELLPLPRMFALSCTRVPLLPPPRLA